MKRLLLLCSMLVPVVVSGCASPLASRTAQVKVGNKDVQVQVKGTQGTGTSTLGLYVDGVQHDQDKKFWPFASSYTFKATLDKAVLEVPCAWEATSNGWGQKVDCKIYVDNKEAGSFPTF